MKYTRIYKILAVMRAYRLSELLPHHRLSFWLKVVIASLFWVKNRAKGQLPEERLRLALQALGPIWIKLGQMLSTRRDLLPADIANQLALLQDKVAPFEGKLAIEMIEDALGQPISEHFDEFDIIPLASASIAQVHTATMKGSRIPVVIKVLRPNLFPTIQADLSLMYFVADKLPNWIQDGERLKARDIVRDYENTILKELNLQQEADNTLRLRANFIDSDILYIPYVYRDLCRKNILVEERIYGIPIANIDALKRANVNLKLLAERGVEAFFTQVFRDNFFHADMHPGNIFVDIRQPHDPRYIGIDCAIVGELTQDDQYYLAENFIAFFNRDYHKIAQLYIESGWVSEETDIYEFEQAMRQVCDPIFAKPLGEISFAQVLFNLFSVARQFNMEVQPQLILLEKTLFYIEGLGRQLYPELDLWKTAKPFLEAWYAEKISVKSVAKQIVETLPAMTKLFPQLPAKIKQQERANRRLKSKLDHLSSQLYTLQKRQRRQFCLFSGVVITVALLLIIL
ncbi:ubiquinone biosynthesis regulatory protein kinase UbiB [Utexia brackfieldae]|uniref:ubiquinone biosynthesis regulatory protein kinase UbiB n=1 Tax=Utexia brackfieldae TaxID=3074108 RepID=UPI00370D86B0